MATESLDQLLNDFIEAWNAGTRPSVDEYIARAPEAEQTELAGLINSFLEIAPTPDYSAEQLAEIRADPTVKEIAELIESAGGLWPKLLPRLRKRAKLKREEVVASLANTFGLQGREDKIARYYHEMETGLLPSEHVSRKVLSALAGLFKVDVRELEESGSFGIEMPAVADVLYTRTDDSVHLEALERVEAQSEVRQSPGGPPEATEMDEVDRLFRGGR
jgi:hypothetical protein